MDPKGLIFAIASLRKTLLLYDLRSYDKGPFFEFSIPISSTFGPPEPNLVVSSSVSSFEFSADGQKIATLALNELEIVVSIIDSFEGRVFSCISCPVPYGYLDPIKDPENSCKKMGISLSVTPDSNYFMSFIAKRRLDLYLQAWKFDNGHPVSLFDPCVNKNTCNLVDDDDQGYHTTLTKFNHKYMMMASTCDNNLILWQPDVDKTFPM
ncbi:hypothetical protein MXB_675 [Myxobolus squamalis]|nr:hypothetical protein MXB_675 [Myxobolus squamalis]